MNVERMRELANIIRRAGDGTVPAYRLSCWLITSNGIVQPESTDELLESKEHPCDSVGCIAGLTCWYWADEIPRGAFDYQDAAIRILGLEYDPESSNLFVPSDFSGAYGASQEQAADLIDKCADAGRVLGWVEHMESYKSN